MKAWTVLLALGAVALATGGTLVALGLHHTIGLYGVGLGALLVLGGLVMSLRGRKGGTAEDRTRASATTFPSKGRGGLRNILIAVSVVVIIGIATFFGTTYLAGTQAGGGSQTGITSSQQTTIPSSSSVSSSSQSSSVSSSSQSSVQTTSLASCSTAPVIALDGSAINYTGSGSSARVSLTTIKSPDVIVIYVTVVDSPMGSDSSPPAVSNITDGSGSLSFQKRASIVTSSQNAGSDKFSVEEWYAIANGTLSSDSIIVKTTNSTPVITIVAFGISGANTTSPFDSTSLVPSSGTGAGNGTISVNISTKGPNDMIIGGAGMSSTSPAAGSGYTLIASDGGQSFAQDPIAEYAVTCAAGNNYTASFNGERSGLQGTQTWVMIADAVAEATQA